MISPDGPDLVTSSIGNDSVHRAALVWHESGQAHAEAESARGKTRLGASGFDS